MAHVGDLGCFPESARDVQLLHGLMVRQAIGLICPSGTRCGPTWYVPGM